MSDSEIDVHPVVRLPSFKRGCEGKTNHQPTPKKKMPSECPNCHCYTVKFHDCEGELRLKAERDKNQPDDGKGVSVASDPNFDMRSKGSGALPCSAFLPLPKPSYPCMHRHCSEEVSYPPDMLYWAEDGSETKGWMCDNCWNDHDWNNGEIPPKGITLEMEISLQNKQITD